MNRCRICHDFEITTDTMLRRGIRHWVHKRCYITSGKPLDALTRAQIGSLPWNALKDAGLIAEAERLIASPTTREGAY